MRRVRALALALAVSACSRSSNAGGTAPPPPPPEPPPAPAGLTLAPTASFGLYDAAWTAPAGEISGYEMEGRVGDAPFAKIHQGLLPASPAIAGVDARADPELAWIEIRLRAVRGGLASAWSNVASARQGLQAPLQIWAELSDVLNAAPPIVVSWILPSPALTTDVVLERSEAGVASPDWRPIPGVAPGQTTCADGDVEDGRSYRYRLRRVADGVESASVTSNPSSYLAVLGPVDPAVSLLIPDPAADPVGFRVTWTNRSASADLAFVDRQTVVDTYPSEVATTGIAGPYDDVLDWPPWPGMRYRLRAFRGGAYAPAGESAWAEAPGFTLSGALVLDARTVALPAGEGFAQDGAGMVHVLRPRPFDGAVPSILRPTAGGWETHALEGEIGVIVPPGITLDPDGHPHVAYVLARSFLATTSTVRHVWYDGVGWRSSDLELQEPEAAAAFAAGPGGVGHLVTTRPATGTTTLVHAEGRDGAWTQTVLPAVGFYTTPKELRAGADGTLVLAVPASGEQAFALAVRPPGGTWALEQIPGAVSNAGTLAAGGAGRALVMFVRGAVVPPASQVQYWAVFRDPAGAYSPPALVATGPTTLYLGPPAALAMTPDGSRSVFVLRLADDAGVEHTELFVRGASGGWRRMRIGPPSATPLLSLAPDRKVRVLAATWDVGAGTRPQPLLTEP